MNTYQILKCRTMADWGGFPDAWLACDALSQFSLLAHYITIERYFVWRGGFIKTFIYIVYVSFNKTWNRGLSIEVLLT